MRSRRSCHRPCAAGCIPERPEPFATGSLMALPALYTVNPQRARHTAGSLLRGAGPAKMLRSRGEMSVVVADQYKEEIDDRRRDAALEHGRGVAFVHPPSLRLSFSCHTS